MIRGHADRIKSKCCVMVSLANAAVPVLLPHGLYQMENNEEIVRANRARIRRERQLVLHTVKRAEKIPKESGKSKTLLSIDSNVAVSKPLSPRGKAVHEKSENGNYTAEKGEKEGRKKRSNRSGKSGSSDPSDRNESDRGESRRREKTRCVSLKNDRHKNTHRR